MANGNSSWLKSKVTGNCKDLPPAYVGVFPDLDPSTGYTQCLLLNMSGTSFDDLWFFKSCYERHGYLCRPTRNYQDHCMYTC